MTRLTQRAFFGTGSAQATATIRRPRDGGRVGKNPAVPPASPSSWKTSTYRIADDTAQAPRRLRAEVIGPAADRDKAMHLLAAAAQDGNSRAA